MLANMRMVVPGVWPPVEIDSVLRILELLRCLLSYRQTGDVKQERLLHTHQRRIHFDFVFSWQELEFGAICGQQEVVVAGHAVFPNVQPAPTGQRAFSVYPDIERLNGLTTAQFHEHALDDLAALCRAVKQGPKIDFRRRAGRSVCPEVDRGGLRHPHRATPEQGQPRRGYRNGQRQDRHDDADGLGQGWSVRTKRVTTPKA